MNGGQGDPHSLDSCTLVEIKKRRKLSLINDNKNPNNVLVSNHSMAPAPTDMCISNHTITNFLSLPTLEVTALSILQDLEVCDFPKERGNSGDLSKRECH